MKVSRAVAAAAILAAATSVAKAQTAQTTVPSAAPVSTPATAADDMTLLTVFFKHDQSKTLSEINEQLRKNGYYEKFPPPGVEVVSWYVVMGIGQIATFRFPASRLREMNRVIEDTAWGRLSHRVLPDLRLQGRRRSPAPADAGQAQIEPAHP